MYLKYLFHLCVIITLIINNAYAKEKELEPISIQLKWFFQYQFAGVIMAKEMGFYEREGLDLTIKERDPLQNNILQVIAGESQYGIADSVILRYRAQNHPVKALASIFQHNPMVLISKKDSGIVSPFEMKGKRISYQEGLDDSIISSLLDFARLDSKDIVKKPMDFTHMDFVDGKVDISEAYLSIEPYWMKEKYGIEVNVIDPKNYGIDFYGDIIFTTEDEINNHPKRVEAFKKATLEGWAYALQHQEETIKLILEKYNTRDLNYDQLLYEARVTKNLIATDYIPLGDIRKEPFTILKQLYLSKGIDEQDLDNALNELIYDPNARSNIFTQYLYPIVITSLALLLLVLLLSYYNSRLSRLVAKRTKELEESKLQAELAANSKSMFLANMSHEIRTPMNAILGFVEQLAKNETNPQRQKMFQTIQNSSQTLLTIINDILDISKLQSGKLSIDLQDCHLKSFFDEIEDLFASACEEKNIEFHVHLENNTPECARLDDIRLKQIIINLLSNAIKFTDPGGSIRLDTSYVKVNQALEIFVLDTGKGISSDHIDNIFNTFEQEDSSITRRFGGTGLGLAISKQLITLMQGQISVHSKEGEGSRFYLRLPYLPCEASTPLDEISDQTDKEELKALSGKVMIVEDNKTNQLLLSMILDDLHLEYEIAHNGQEAVYMFKKSKEFAIILMDENMPIMNGIEATKQIREEEKNQGLDPLPIIAVTANALSSDKERFLEAGMNDYVAKPYAEATIKKILLEYL